MTALAQAQGAIVVLLALGAAGLAAAELWDRHGRDRVAWGVLALALIHLVPALIRA